MSSQPESTGLLPVADGVWVLRYPLHILGENSGRVVTVLRLSSGDLVIHSTAPFSAGDVAAIREVGRPAWLVDCSLPHDTFARKGWDAFPDLPYLAPAGFREATRLPTGSLEPPPEAWAGELEVLEIEGMPSMREYVFFHVASRTLVVGDLIFNFTHDDTKWEWLLRHYALGLKGRPGVNRVFHALVSNREAFAASARRMLEWDFQRVIVGHGEIYATNAKDQTRTALAQSFRDLKF